MKDKQKRLLLLSSFVDRRKSRITAGPNKKDILVSSLYVKKLPEVGYLSQSYFLGRRLCSVFSGYKLFRNLPWRRGLGVSSPPATEETGAMGREIKSRQGIWC
jgi:hypothetical protein